MLNNLIQAPITEETAGIPNSSVNVTSPNVPFPKAVPADYNPVIEYDFKNQNLSDILTDISKKLPSSNILSPVYTPQEQAKRYASSEFYNPVLDNEEIAAKNQSWVSKWGSGLAKMGGLAAGTFAEGILQVPDIINGKNDGSIWKGDWYDSVDTWMNNLEDKFPNYYTAWEKEHPFVSAVPFSGGGANFWSDKFAKNLGFTIGAIGSAVVTDLAVGTITEGIGEIPLIANQVGKASLWMNKLFTGTNRLEEVLNTARALNKSDETMLTIKNMAQASAAQKLLNSTRYYTTLGMASNTEAGIEARQSYNTLKQELIDEYTSNYGSAPTGAELDKIEQYATSAGNSVYALNMAILSTSNALQFEHILKPWNSYKQDLKKGIESTVQEQTGKIGVKTSKTGEDISKLSLIEEPKTLANKAWNVIKPIAPNIFSEGVFEEGGQFAASEGVKNYFKDKYNGKIAGNLNDIINSVGQGLAKQFGTTEGLENMLIGGLTGVLISPISNKVERAQRAKAGVLTSEEATNKVINNLNQKSVTGLFQNNYSNAAQSLKHNEDLNKAISEDNIFAFKNLKADEFYNFVINGLQNNRADVRKVQLEMLKELSDEELNKVLNIPNGTRESNHAYIDKLINNANQIEKQYNAIGNTFSNPFNYRGNIDKLSEKQKEPAIKENAAWFAFEDYKAALVKMSYNITDFNQRLNSIQQDVAKINPALTNSLISKLANPKQLNNLKVDYKEQANNLSEQLNTVIKRSENPELYASTSEQIKAFNTYAEQISKFLNTRDSNQLPALFNKLLNFEANGRTGKTDNIVDPVYNKDLLNFANDINQINKGKDMASSTYDYLFTQEGYEDFIKNHEEWANSLNFKEPEKTLAEEQVEIDGNVYEIGKAYKNNYPNRYTVPTGTTQLKNPFGEIVDTFKTKEEAEAARDIENKNIDSKLADVIFLGQENGRAIVQDSDGNVQYVDFKMLKNFEKALSEEDIVNDNKDFYDTLDKELDKDSVNFPEYLSGEDTLESVLKTAGEFESPKKPKELVNWSTTFDPASTKNYYNRQKQFFSEFDKFPQDVKDNARVIFVTANNQKALGLDGLVEKMLEGGFTEEYKIDDPAKTPVLAVFVKQEGDTFKYLDLKGNVIEPSIDNIIIATMPVPKLEYRSIEDSPWRNDTPKDFIKKDSENWLNTRKQILANTGIPKMYNFTLSNGFSILDKNIDNTLNYHSVSDVLVSNRDLSKGNYLKVSTGTPINNLKFNKGALVFINGNTTVKLDNRTFNDEEANNIFDILKVFVKQATTGDKKLNKEILNFFMGIMYWQKLEKNAPIGNSQVYLSSGFLHIGKDNVVPFTIKGIKDNENKIKDAFKSVYVNANNKFVQNNTPFKQLFVDGEGNIKSFTWQSYQHYLVSDRYNIEEDEIALYNQKRNINDIPFRTPIIPSSDVDVSFTNRYAIIGNSTDENAPFNLPVKIENKQTPVKKEEVKTEKPKESTKTIDLTGKPTNNFKTSLGNIRFSAKKNKSGNYDISAITDEIYKKYITGLVSKPTKEFTQYAEYFEEEINKELAEDFLISQIDDYIINTIDSVPKEAPTVKQEEQIKKEIVEVKEQKIEAPKTPVKESPKEINDLDLGTWNQEAFRLVLDAFNYTEHDIEKSEKWFKENIPVDYKRVKHLISTTSGGYAWGRFYNNVAEWYENAKKGTIEHEGFEAIWANYATLNEKKDILKEFNSRKGSFVSAETGRNINYSDATEYQAKEELADELGRYVLDGELYETPKEGKNKIYQFFKNLVDFVKKLLGMQPNKIKQMFDKINTGYYKGGIYVDPKGNDTPEYSIVNLTESDSYNVVRGITHHIVVQLFSSNRSLLEFDEVGKHDVEALYKRVYANMDELFNSRVPEQFMLGNINEVQFAKFQTLWNAIKSDNEHVNKLVQEYLSTFGIKADLEGLSFNDEEVLTSTDKESTESDYGSRRDDSYAINQFKIDAKKTASNSVKLLIATLPETVYISEDDKTRGTKPKLDSNTLMPQMVNYNKTFNFLLNQLYDLNTWDEKEKKLIELGKDYPNYVALNKRLKIGAKDVDMDTWSLRTKFFNVMSKQRPGAYIHFIGKDENGKPSSRVRPVNLNALTNEIAQSWLDTLKLAASSPNNIITLNNNEDYVFDGEKLSKNPLKSALDILDYLKGLNIPFTTQLYNKLSKDEKRLLDDTVHKLHSSLKNAKGIVEITPSKLNNAGNFLKIAQLYLKVNEETTSTFYNIDGEKQQQFIGNNFPSQVLNDINNSTNKERMYNTLPFMQDVYRQDSQYLNKILFNAEGDRTGKFLSIGYTQGLVDSINDKEISNSKMIAPVRMIEQINNELRKNYYIMVPADSQTEWMLGMDHILPYSMFYGSDINDRIYRIFNKYYQTERNIAPKDAEGNIVVDKDNISKYKSTMYHNSFNTNYLSVDLNKSKFIEYIDNNVNSIIQYLKDNHIITWNKNKPDTFIIKGLDTEFAKSNSITVNKRDNSLNFTEKELFDFFKFTEVNYMINNIEINKLFFGDTAFIKDPLKRYKSFLSPRELAMYNSESYNKTLNETLNKAGNTIVLNKNDYGYWQHKEYIPTVTVRDIASGELSILNDRTVSQYHDDYSKTNPADGQSWGFLPAYREILYKNGGRFSKEQEELYQYVTALDRKAMYEDGHLNDNSNSKYYYRPELQKQDEKTIEKGYNGTETFHIIKPIGSGITLEGEIFLDKTSLAPLSYTLVRGTALEQHYLNMWRQGVGYIIMESGRKLASSNPEDFYYKNGKVNTDKYKTIKNVPHRYYGVQVETEGRHHDGPLGSQLSKLGVVNLRDAGVAKSDTVQKMIERHNSALRNLSEFGYEQLLKKLGIIDYGDRYAAPNKKKILKLLKEELFKRETPQNLKESLSLDANGEFKIPFEAMANYQQIKDILYSFVDKLIAKPRMNGGPKIQLSGTGFEKEVRTVKTKDGKEYLVSNGLKFYEAEYDDNGNRTRVNRMQVMLPMWFWDKIKNHPRWKNATNEEILKYLNNTQAGQKVLKGIGFRIPTQELNSVEAFEVVGFTPKWMGDMIILPEAITTKSGGDFDVDKLNTYLKNVYLTPDGDIRVIPYYGYGKEARAKFDELDIAAEYSEADDVIEDILSGSIDIYQLDKIADKMYAESLQNEYFDSLSDLLLLPENFERLIRPNSAEEGKALRRELEKAAPSEFEGGKDKSILNRMYMSNMRHLFLIGKAWVGISASSQTNNALNQSTQVVLNPDKIKELSKVEQQYIGNGEILLPHNSLVQNGRKVATLSRTTDVSGEFISDKISRYIDGPVDIAKDPWITQLFQTTQIFSIALTLEKLGVPDRDVVFFLNQPIIREYIKYLNDLNTTWALNKKNIENILKKFNLKPVKVSRKDGVTFIENPLTVNELNTKTFKANIEKYYNGGKFTQAENEQQKTIFYEFLKYSVLSGQLFNMQQALLWDTNPEPDPYRQYRKNNKVNQVQTGNVFTDLNEVFDNTQIGAIRKNVTRGSKAIDQSFSIYNDNIRSVIRATVDNLPERGIDYEKAVRGIEESFLTFILQTNLGINNDIKKLMVDLESNIASKVYFLKLDLQENQPKSDLANNIALKQIISIAKNKKKEVKNIKIAQKAVDVFTSDVYTNAFRELRDNERTRELYNNIITLSLLQSGLAQSPVSFNKYIPYEDYAANISGILKNIQGAPNIQNFLQTGSFFRNSWKNTDLVPNMKEEIKDNGDSGNYLRTKWFQALKEQKGITEPLYQLYKIDINKGIARSKYVTFDKYLGEDEFGNVLEKTILLQRIDDEFGNPVFLPERVEYGIPSQKGNYMYVPINAWGDGMFLQEHYNDLRPSVVLNNALRIGTELTTAEIIEAYNNRANLDNSQKNVIFAEPKIEMEENKNIINELDKSFALATIQYLTDYYKDNSIYYTPLDLNLSDKELEKQSLEYESGIKNLKKVTINNYLEALKLEELYGDVAFDNNNIKKSNNISVLPESIIIQNNNVEIEYSFDNGFKNIYNDYINQKYSDFEKESYEQFLTKYGLGRFLKGYDPNQLTLFSATDIESQIDNLINQGLIKENCK